MATNTDFIVKNGIVVTDSSTFGNTITGTDAVFTGSITASNILDSADIIGIIASEGLDSNLVTSIVDSAYIVLRDRFQDSGLVTSTVTKAFVDALNIDADQLDGQEGTYYLDYNNFTNSPNVLDSGRVSNIITADVDQAFVNALNIDADNLDGQTGSFYLDYNNFTNTPNVLDSADIINLVDSAYIQARQITGGGGTGTVDSAYVLSVVDSAAVPFSQTFYHFTADSGQITFSGFDDDSDTLAYTTGALAVYLNGILLVDSVDYTASNGTSIILTDSAAAGDVLSVLKFGGNTTGIDSANVINLIDSAYINARVNPFDSSHVLALVDSAYIQLRDRFQDSSGILAIVDSAYVQARQTTGTDSATVSAIIANDVTTDYIFAKTKIKSSSNYFIQPTEPTITDVDQYWYKSDSDILYKSVPSTTLTTTMPAVSLASGTPYNKQVDYPGLFPSSATRTNISGTDALGGTFTLGTTAEAWFYFYGGPFPANPAYLNGGVYYTFDSDQDLRGIIIENADPNSGRLERIDYRNGDYADNGFPGGGTVTWYNSGGTPLGKTAAANTTGNTFVDISHPTGELAYRIGFSQIGDYYASNDVFLFFAGGRFWQEIDRSRTDAEISTLASSDIDSAYIESRRPAESIFDVVNNGSSAYTFTGDGFSSGRDNPTLYLTRGKTYKFNVNASSHPLEIRSSNGGSAYNTGVTNNNNGDSAVLFTPDMNAPTSLVYQCTVHSGMVGDIVILDDAIGFGKVYVSGQDVITADSQSSVLSFEAGQGITLQTDANTDTVTITNALNAEVARGIIDSAYVQSRQTHYLDSALITQLIDSAYVTARAPAGGGGGGGGGVDSASTITLIEATVDSAYIGTKVDFTRGEFVNEKSQYTATASQTVFNHSSIDPTHLDVYLNGILQVVNDDYTATTSAVTFTAGVDSGYSVTIVEKRGRVATQRGLVESKYYFTTPTPTSSITGADDNGITLDYSDGFLDVYLNGMLLKDSDDYSTNAGTTVTLVSATDSNDLVTLINRKGVVVTPNVKNYEFTASAGQTTFSGADINGNTLAYVPGAAQVFLNGILLRNVDYTGITGTSIVLVDSASLNDELVVSAFSNPGQNMDLYKFTADSGQTIFSGNDLAGASLAYQPGNIQVFMNGLLLNDSDDYIASNGMSVVLTSGADLSDEIKIASFVSNTDVIRTNAWSAPTGTPVTAAAGDKLFIDTSSAKTVTLPSSASLGDEIRIIDVTGNAATNNITVARNGHKIQGAASDLTINVDRAGIGLVYYNVAQGWVLIEN